MKKIKMTRKQALKYGSAVVAAVAATPSFAVTTLTVLPAAAATATDSLIGLGTDVGTILFAIGTPVLLAVIGWKVFKGGAKKGASL